MGRFNNGMEAGKIAGSTFGFTGIGLHRLGATEYTLVDIVVDITGSVSDFKDELLACLKTAVSSCQKSPRSENLLLRVTTFNSAVGIVELHGYMPLSEINVDDYKPLDPDGYTNLFDATYQAVGASIQYGQKLMENDFLCNAIVYVITDGDDNRSKMTPKMVGQVLEDARKTEKLESIVSILIGVNAQSYRHKLEAFQIEAGLTQYVDVSDASKGKLAKLAGFISQSVSSQSQAVGTGGPSQNIDATI